MSGGHTGAGDVGHGYAPRDPRGRLQRDRQPRRRGKPVSGLGPRSAAHLTQEDDNLLLQEIDEQLRSLPSLPLYNPVGSVFSLLTVRNQASGPPYPGVVHPWTQVWRTYDEGELYQGGWAITVRGAAMSVTTGITSFALKVSLGSRRNAAAASRAATALAAAEERRLAALPPAQQQEARRRRRVAAERRALALRLGAEVVAITVTQPLSVMSTWSCVRHGNEGLVQLWKAVRASNAGSLWAGLGAHVVVGVAGTLLHTLVLSPLTDRWLHRAKPSRAQLLGEARMQRAAMQHRVWQDARKNAITVAVAMLARILLFPLTSVRLRLEARGALESTSGPDTKDSLVSCVQQVWRSEGLRGFYRGLGAYVTGMPVEAAFMGIGLMAASITCRLMYSDDDDGDDDGDNDGDDEV